MPSRQRESRTAAALVVAAVCVVSPALARAQQPPEVEVVPVLVDATRIESWSFFEPFSSAAESDYILTGNRATLGVATATRHVEAYGALQYAQLLNLPRRAVAAGPLGPGAFYYDAARAPNAYQLYFKALSLRVRNLPGGVSFEVGRMGFNSGGEASSASAELEALKRHRAIGRTLGEAEWTPFERAFDGLRADVARRRWHANGAVLFPSQGAYEESANATISAVRVATASLTWWSSPQARPDVGPIGRLTGRPRAWLFVPDTGAPATFELQGFAQHYRDRRSERPRPDNTFGVDRQVDVDVETYGGSMVGAVPVAGGRADVLAWMGVQRGNWYGLRHRGFSAVVEAGYRFTTSPWSPWVRAGLRHASGDADRFDLQHDTFFPGLPTTTPSLLAGTFASMNLRDAFGEVRVQPRHWLGVNGEVHRLTLPTGSDRWYSGTGATAIRGDFFGFSGRPALATSLGTLVQVGAEATVSPRWRLRGSFGVVDGGAVVERLFLSDRLTVVAVESLLTFGR